jgi:hypothetical protein
MKRYFVYLIALLLFAIVPELSSSYTLDNCFSGGNVALDGDYCVHTFLANATFVVTQDITAEVLMVGGGGAGGGGWEGAGGGAGGLVYNSSRNISSGSYNISIGQGGLPVSNMAGGKGLDSIFNGTIAYGGGGGATLNGNGSSGGSGGGGTRLLPEGYKGTGVAGQGNDGGIKVSGCTYGGGGGGGGAGAVGGNNVLCTGGAGGSGLNYSINGTNTYYAGGGGSSGNTAGGSGGLGGGGAGVGPNLAGYNGTNGLGGGGGGVRTQGYSAGYGGSGVVVIRYYALEDPDGITIELRSPLNNTFSSSSLVTLNSTGTISDNTTAFSNVALWDNSTGSWMARNVLNSKFLCYQESVNTANQTGIDGNCNLNYTGAYEIVGSPARDGCSDGDWSSDCIAVYGNSFFYYANYTIPNDVSGATLMYKIGISTGNFYSTNVTIPTNCLANSKLSLKFKINNSYPNDNTASFCYNGSDYTLLSNNDNQLKLFEEAIYWNISSSPNSASFANTYPDNRYIWNTAYTLSNGTSYFASSNYTFTVDTTAPRFNASLNFSTAYVIGGKIKLNTTINDTNLASCWYNYNNANATINGCLSNTLNQTEITTVAGKTNITIYANDSAGNVNSTIVSFSFDPVPPSISIIYPIATNYSVNVTQLNFTVNDTNLDSCWYSLGEANISVSCTSNLSNLVSSWGNSTWAIYSNDTVGNTVSASVNFYQELFYSICYVNGTGCINNTANTTWQEGANMTITAQNSLITDFYSWFIDGVSYLSGVGKNVLNWIMGNNVINPTSNIYMTAITNYSCYQESFDTRNQTGIDGSCNLVYSGSYSETGGTCGASCFVNITYKKPSNNNNLYTSAIWQVKHNQLGIYNITLPSDCFNYSSVEIKLRAYSRESSAQSESALSCFNGTEWKNVGYSFNSRIEGGNGMEGGLARLFDGDWNTAIRHDIYNSYWSYDLNGLNNSALIFEEAIIWTGTSDLRTQNFTINTNSSAPSMNLSSPITLSNVKIGDNVALNISASDLNLDKVWYNYNGTNVTINGARSGSYNASNITLNTKSNVTIYANDSVGNLNYSTFTWNYSNPIVSISSPINGTIFTNNTFLLNTSTTSGWNISQWIYNFNETNYTSTNQTTLTSWINNISVSAIPGTYNLKVYATSDVGTTGLNDSIYYSIDMPVASLNYPLNGMTTSDTINFNCSAQTFYPLSNVTLQVWNSTGLIISNTTTISGTNNYTIFTQSLAVDGNHTWNCLFYDNQGKNFTASNYTFTADFASPIIQLNSPSADQIFNNESLIVFNYTPQLTLSTIDTCSLYTNTSGTWGIVETDYNITKNVVNSFNISNLAEGIYNWNVWCNASNGNSGFAPIGNQTFRQDVNPPSVSILSPTGTVSSRTLNINVSYSDVTSASYCFYNITIGELVLKSNTALNLVNFSAIESSGIDGTFTLKVWCNDSLGKNGSASSTFTVDTSVPSTPPSGGGGGGGTVIIEGEAGWSMEVAQGLARYEKSLSPGYSLRLSIDFENLGSSSRNIILSCQDINGSICQYVTFEEKEFVLPLIKNTKTKKYFRITLPEDAPKGQFRFNIKATDDLTRSGSVSIALNTDLGAISTVFTKLGSSTESGFPYLIIFIVVFTLSLIIFRLIFKKIPYGAFWNLVLSLLVSIGILLFV